MHQPDTAETDWMADLSRRGATLTEGGGVRFGDPAHELAAVAAGQTVHLLTDVALIRVTGADAAAFLQTQLSNDITRLEPSRAQLSTYCTPQGRMLASLVVWRDGDAFMLALARSLAEEVLQRLRKYVLRAKASLQEAGDRYGVFGLSGDAGIYTDLLGTVPIETMGLVSSASATCIGLADGLYLIIVQAAHALPLWDRLTAAATPAGTDAWAWRMIQARIPIITAATQGLFVPQMCNFDQLGAISFQKGCYPGQEIVARAQHRGEVKRRLYLLHADTDAAAAGHEVFRAGGAGCGTVVNAASAPQGGMDLLAVILTEAATHAELRLGAPDGPSLRLCR